MEPASSVVATAPEVSSRVTMSEAVDSWKPGSSVSGVWEMGAGAELDGARVSPVRAVGTAAALVSAEGGSATAPHAGTAREALTNASDRATRTKWGGKL
jgi:hypothetical protein